MQTRPNLLFLYTDEQRPDTLAAYGNHTIQMPNLNRLTDRSTVFEQAYCTSPVCTPSRGSIVTGLYPRDHGAVTNNLPLRREALCLPERLPQGRYTCGHFGKWHLGDEIFPQHGFTDWRATEDTYHTTFQPPHPEFTPERSAYHHWLVARGVKPRDLHAVVPPEKWHPAFENRFFREQIHALPEELSRPAFLAEQSVDFIRSNRQEPWVLYVNFLEPHMPFHSCRDNQYDPADVVLPAAWRQELSANTPLRLRLQAAENKAKGRNTERALRAVIARYWGMCSLVDAHVGRILDELDSCGLAENTIIVFTSDHGDMMGSHGLHGKGQMFEGSAGVPLFFHTPGQTVQRRVAGPASQIDLVPTLLDLLGEPVAPGLPGRSLRPQLEGRQATVGRDVFLQWTRDFTPPKEGVEVAGHWQGLGTPASIAAALGESVSTVITPDGWKFSRSSVGDDELYYLRDDPWETTNRVHETAQAARVRDLAARVAEVTSA
jgi:arylsulfatase A-like enzyme